MAKETASWVTQLDTANPVVGDPVGEGDDHLRMLKTVLKNSFPSTSTTAIVPDVSGESGKFLTNDGTDTSWGTAGSSTPVDNTFRIQDNSDATKQIAFEASGITTSTTRTITMPDSDVTLVSSGAIVNADVNASAAIAQSKLSLDITNSDINASAAIAQSKLATLAIDTAELADDAVTVAKMNDSAYLANRNMIINGDFNVWQRATSSTAGGYGYETADRWYFGGDSGAGKQTTRQSGTPQEGFQYHMKVDANGIPASNYVGVEQAIETSTVVPLRSQTITVSVYARKGASAQADNTYQLRLAQSNSTDARSTLNFGTGLTNTTMSLTTSFVRYSATVTVASDAVGISCSLVLTAGSSTATANDYIEITGVQLEIGDTATPFEHKTYGQELQDCQRYYEKSYNQGTDPATATAVGAWMWRHTDAGPGVNTVSFQTPKRATPTMVSYGRASGTSGKITNMSGGAADTTATAFNTGECSVTFSWTSTGSETYVEGHWTADAEL